MTTIYSVSPMEDTGNGVGYFSTKAKAMAAARAIAKEGTTATVTKETINQTGFTRRQLYCALLNQEGYCVESEVIAEFRGTYEAEG